MVGYCLQIITLHERNIIKLMEPLNSQMSLSRPTHITRPIAIVRILGLACYPLFSNICVCKHNNNHMDVDAIHDLCIN